MGSCWSSTWRQHRVMLAPQHGSMLDANMEPTQSHVKTAEIVMGQLGPPPTQEPTWSLKFIFGGSKLDSFFGGVQVGNIRFWGPCNKDSYLKSTKIVIWALKTPSKMGPQKMDFWVPSWPPFWHPLNILNIGSGVGFLGGEAWDVAWTRADPGTP